MRGETLFFYYPSIYSPTYDYSPKWDGRALLSRDAYKRGKSPLGAAHWSSFLLEGKLPKREKLFGRGKTISGKPKRGNSAPENKGEREIFSSPFFSIQYYYCYCCENYYEVIAKSKEKEWYLVIRYGKMVFCVWKNGFACGKKGMVNGKNCQAATHR